MSTNLNNLISIRSTIPGKNLPNRRELLWLNSGKVCYWCGRATRLVDGDSADQATIDHVIPRYKGGSNDISNTVSSCRGCNARRNTEDMKGLKDGSLLGNHNFKGQPDYNKKKPKYVSLTGDEKKAIIGKTSAEDALRIQRDQAHLEITRLNKELKHWEATVTIQREEMNALESLTLWKFIRKRLSNWLAP